MLRFCQEKTTATRLKIFINVFTLWLIVIFFLMPTTVNAAIFNPFATQLNSEPLVKKIETTTISTRSIPSIINEGYFKINRQKLEDINHSLEAQELSYKDLFDLNIVLNKQRKVLNNCFITGQSKINQISQLLKSLSSSRNNASLYIQQDMSSTALKMSYCIFLIYQVDEVLVKLQDQISKKNTTVFSQRNKNIKEILTDFTFLKPEFTFQTVNQLIQTNSFSSSDLLNCGILFIVSIIIAFWLNIAGYFRLSTVIFIPFLSMWGYSNMVLQDLASKSSGVLLMNAMLIYALSIWSIKWGLKREISDKLILYKPLMFNIFNMTISIVCFIYVIMLNIIHTYYEFVPIYLYNFYPILYLAVFIRISFAVLTNTNQWISPYIKKLLAFRLNIIGTIVLFIYVIHLIFINQTVSFQLQYEELSILLYSMVYLTLSFWFGDIILKSFYYRYALSELSCQKITSLFWLIYWVLIGIIFWGYQEFAQYFLLRIFVTFVCLAIIKETNEYVNDTYHQFIVSSNQASRHFRSVLGIKPNKKLMELYLLRFVLFNFTILFSFWMGLSEIWGFYQYYLAEFLTNLEHHGIVLFGNNMDPFSVMRAIATFCVIILTGRILAAAIVKKTLSNEEQHTQATVTAAILYVTFATAFILALTRLGVGSSGIVVVAGALSFGVGFGLQHIASDFISGLIIMVVKPVKIGDYVIISNVDGHVKQIGIFSTRIVTSDKADIIFPNSTLIGQAVTNLTFHNNTVTRIKIEVPLMRLDDLEPMKQLLLDVANQHESVINNKDNCPKVVYRFNTLVLKCLIDDVERKKTVTSELYLAISKGCEERHLPLPQISSHIFTVKSQIKS